MTNDKELSWEWYRRAWNERGSTDTMSDLEERTARTKFELQWEREMGVEE